MEIQILVYIGIFLIIILIGLNVYLSWDKIKLLINHSKESKKFESKVKNDLNEEKILVSINIQLKDKEKLVIISNIKYYSIIEKYLFILFNNII